MPHKKSSFLLFLFVFLLLGYRATANPFEAAAIEKFHGIWEGKHTQSYVSGETSHKHTENYTLRLIAEEVIEGTLTIKADDTEKEFQLSGSLIDGNIQGDFIQDGQAILYEIELIDKSNVRLTTSDREIRLKRQELPNFSTSQIWKGEDLEFHLPLGIVFYALRSAKLNAERKKAGLTEGVTGANGVQVPDYYEGHVVINKHEIPFKDAVQILDTLHGTLLDDEQSYRFEFTAHDSLSGTFKLGQSRWSLVNHTEQERQEKQRIAKEKELSQKELSLRNMRNKLDDLMNFRDIRSRTDEHAYRMSWEGDSISFVSSSIDRDAQGLPRHVIETDLTFDVSQIASTGIKIDSVRADRFVLLVDFKNSVRSRTIEKKRVYSDGWSDLKNTGAVFGDKRTGINIYTADRARLEEIKETLGKYIDLTKEVQ